MRDAVCGRGVCVEALEGRRLMTVGFVETGHVVRMETTLGRITVELSPDVTPLTVRNFLKNYVWTGAYDNTLVHRSVPGFVIQGGGYRSTGKSAPIPTAPPVVNEFENDRIAAGGGGVNVRGTMAMAKLGGDPNSATSQWFINLADNASNLDHQNAGFTVFGRVIGGGMHTADAIAGLEVLDATHLNPAFGSLPVMSTSLGTVSVVVKSVRGMEDLTVRLGGKTKTVNWVDERGATATITLSGGGTADLKFVGSGVRVTQAGNAVTVTGAGLELAEVAAHGTKATSVLAITSRGGKAPAHVGDITTNGGLKQIDAGTVRLEGDITAAGRVGRIDFAQTNGSVITVGGSGGMVLNVGTAVDTSVKTTMGLKSMTVGKWVEDGWLPTSIEANGIRQMVVTGDFSADVTSSGGVGTVVVNGDIGAMGASTWNVAWKVGQVRARSVKGLTVNAQAVKGMTVAGGIESSTITAKRSIGSVVAAGMKSTVVRAGGYGTDGGFLNAGGMVGAVTLNGKGETFKDSNIQGPTVGRLNLGTVAAWNGGRVFGVRTLNGVTRLDARFGKVAVSMSKVKDEARVASYFASKKINPGNFDVEFVG